MGVLSDGKIQEPRRASKRKISGRTRKEKKWIRIKRKIIDVKYADWKRKI